MKISDATPDDVWTVARDMRERDFAEFTAVYPTDDRAMLADMLVERYAGLAPICASKDGRPIAVGAVPEIRPNTVGLLFFATDEFPEIAIGLTKFIVKRLFPPLIEAGIHRIECASLDGYDQVHRWIETLGLKPECTKANFGKRGEAFVEFAWVKE